MSMIVCSNTPSSSANHNRSKHQ